MAWVLYRISNRTVETFSETPFFRVPDHFAQREETTLPANIRRGSVYNAGFTAITNPSVELTLVNEVRQALEAYWTQCRIWTTLLVSFSDANLDIPKKGISFLDRSKMCFQNRFTSVEALTNAQTQRTQRENLRDGCNMARLGALDIQTPDDFARMVNSFPAPTGDPRLWISALGSGPVARTTLANSVTYGSFIVDFDPLNKFWVA